MTVDISVNLWCGTWSCRERVQTRKEVKESNQQVQTGYNLDDRGHGVQPTCSFFFYPPLSLSGKKFKFPSLTLFEFFK